MITTFLDSGKQYLETLQRALAEEDHETLEQTAHAFKGSGLYLGAKHLVQTCQKLEQLGNEINFKDVPDLLKQAGQEFEQVRTALETYLKLNKPPDL